MISQKLQKQLENWKTDTEVRIKRFQEAGRDISAWQNKLDGINKFMDAPQNFSDSDVEDWQESQN